MSHLTVPSIEENDSTTPLRSGSSGRSRKISIMQYHSGQSAEMRRRKESFNVSNAELESFDSVPMPDTDDPDLFDPFCDPDNPVIVKFQDVTAAAFRIKSGIIRTPCELSRLSKQHGMEIYFKKEYQQVTGSFKERGARYTLLSLPIEQRRKGVVAASAGNHALALAYHGQNLGIPVIVVMPITAPMMKINSCATYGAKVIVKGCDLAESKRIAMKMGKSMGYTYINGYDHPDILAGQGTMGLEIMEQVPDVDAVVIAVGGGGLIAGAALAIKSLNPKVKIIGVESDRCPAFTNSLKAGRAISTNVKSTLADGLAVSNVGVNALATAMNVIDRMIVVKEDFIALSILRLVEVEKAVVEGAGATGFAAVISGDLAELAGQKVVIALGGGNIDTTVLGRCLERGLAADGRMARFVVEVTDRPGGIAELAALMSSLSVSIKDIYHERAWVKSDIFSVQVKVVCETRDAQHSTEVEKVLREKYDHLYWGPQAF